MNHKSMEDKHIVWRRAAQLLGTALLVFGAAQGEQSYAEGETPEPETLTEVEVVGTTPTHGVGLPLDKIPANWQTASGEDIERTKSVDITEFLNRNIGSVTINEAQGNPLQPDVQYRGFVAGPLLGLPQGLAVYQNGVRVNEVFGDTVNWELIPNVAINSINLIAGSNPLFGLNTLGGAISVQTKNGFINPGTFIGQVSGGSFGRIQTQAESGGNNGALGYFVALNYFTEDGWRDASPSDLGNAYGSLGWRGEASTLDFSFTWGDSDLTGNGPAPVELLAMDRSAIFTSPDITKNNLLFYILEGSHWLNENTLISANGFYRSNDVDAFNGDATPFEACNPPNAAFLCEEDDPTTPIEDQNGNPIPASFDAINNTSTTEQDSYGGTLQTTLLNDLFDRENQFIFGGSYGEGSADFRSVVEAAMLNADRSTTRTNIFIPDETTALDTRRRNGSLYVTDTLALTEKLALTLSGRYNNTQIKIRDETGLEPRLNGDHTFERFNPAAGATYQYRPDLGFYGGYTESARAPTPVELTCSDPDAPCRLPNAFLADPPLDQVVAKTFEVGARGDLGPAVEWKVDGFHIVNNDDIIFVSTGGATANQGFFDNVGDTKRVGMELGLNGVVQRLTWFVDYTFLDATFQDRFVVSSPNHPLADANGDIQVQSGDRIPSIPQHNLKLGGDVAILPNLSIGGDFLYAGDQFLRGDEANLLQPIDGYVVVNLRGEWVFYQDASVFFKVNNLFNADYETFGLLGEPDEVFPSFSNPRFLTPGAPIGGWIGLRIKI